MRRRIGLLPLLAGLMLVWLPGIGRATEVAPPAGTPYGAEDKPFGLSLAEWEAAWNEWFFSIPLATSPAVGTKAKFTGWASGCRSGFSRNWMPATKRSR